MPEPVRKKNKDGTNKSDVWWLRKKVPERYRAIVGRGEVWGSLETDHFKTAVVRCNKLSLELDREWEDRLRAAQAAGRTTVVPVRAMTDWDLSGLQRVVHEQGREAHIRNPPPGAKWAEVTQCASVGPYRPAALRNHDDFKQLFPPAESAAQS
jgi:hypothetical protein